MRRLFPVLAALLLPLPAVPASAPTPGDSGPSALPPLKPGRAGILANATNRVLLGGLQCEASLAPSRPPATP